MKTRTWIIALTLWTAFSAPLWVVGCSSEERHAALRGPSDCFLYDPYAEDTWWPGWTQNVWEEDEYDECFWDHYVERVSCRACCQRNHLGKGCEHQCNEGFDNAMLGCPDPNPSPEFIERNPQACVGSEVCPNASAGGPGDDHTTIAECLIACREKGEMCNECCGSKSCDPCSGKPCLDADCNECEDPDMTLGDCLPCVNACNSNNTTCAAICHISYSGTSD